MHRRKIKEGIGAKSARWIARLLLLISTITIIFPLIWVFYTSFKSNKEFFADMWALPTEWLVENYNYAWNTAHFSKYFLNSLFVVILSVALTVFISSSISYVIATYRFRWIKWFEKFFLVVMAIPGVLILIPQYFMLLNVGLTDKLWVVATLIALHAVPVNIVLQTGFMRGVSKTLFEAADIDGGTEFQKYFHIMLPNVKSALFLTMLTATLSGWNEYIITLTYIKDEAKYTVPVGLSYLNTAANYGVEYGGLFAGLTIAIIPILVVYAIFQKPLQEGVRMDGSVKE